MDNNANETIFVIEIAVLTVFAFACFGVIIASLCLVKMRHSTKKISKDLSSNHQHQINNHNNKNMKDTKVTKVYRTKPSKTYNIEALNKIMSNSDNSELCHITSPKKPTTSSHHHSNRHKQDRERVSKNKGFDDSPSLSPSHDNEYEYYHHYDHGSKRHRKSNNSECYMSVNSKGRYYVEQLRANRSKSEHIYNHSINQQQIPKYESSKTGLSSIASKISKIGNNSFNISSGTSIQSVPDEVIRAPSALHFLSVQSRSAHHLTGYNKPESISPVIANSPQLPESPINNNKNIIALISQDSDPNLMDSDKPSEYDDVYDLNSDEGDDIKLRRAAIQSQRYTFFVYLIWCLITNFINYP